MHVCYLTKKEMQEDHQPPHGSSCRRWAQPGESWGDCAGQRGHGGVRSVNVGEGLVPSPGAWQG